MAAREPFSTDDEQRLLSALPAMPLRDQALVLLGLDTGFRAKELGALLLRHVVAGDGTVREKIVLERQHLKHGAGVYRAKVQSRAVPLSARSRSALDRYLRTRNLTTPPSLGSPLFLSRKGFGLSVWQINRMVHRVARLAGLGRDRRYGSHSLRKTFARRVHEACGRDINLTRVALGHTSVLVTQRYLGEDHERVDAIIRTLGGERTSSLS